MTAVGAAVRRLRGDDEEDRWGCVASVQPVLDALYDHWWRVRTSGAEHVPPGGAVLVVANHGGLLPGDAAGLPEAGAAAADDRAAVLELAERVRGRVQELVNEQLVARGGAYV